MVTKLFADRLAGEGIPVFEVRPGIILTDMTAKVREKYEKLIAEENPALCRQYGVKGAPTLVVTDGEQYQSYYSVPEIKKYLASV